MPDAYLDTLIGPVGMIGDDSCFDAIPRLLEIA